MTSAVITGRRMNNSVMFMQLCGTYTRFTLIYIRRRGVRLRYLTGNVFLHLPCG